MYRIIIYPHILATDEDIVYACIIIIIIMHCRLNKQVTYVDIWNI